MVLIDTLRLVHAAVQTRRVILRESYDGLNIHKHVECQSQSRVRGLEVLMAGACLVHFNDDEACGQGGGAEDVEEEVRQGACALLLRGVRGLDDEGCLDGEEEAGL